MSKSDLDTLAPTIPAAREGADNLPAFDLNLSPSHLLHRAQQVAADLHVSAFGAAGLTQRQLAVLIVLRADDGISQTELVTRTGIDRSTLAEMVARMQAKDLVVRTKSAIDSRANSVHLSAGGREALQAAMPKLADIDKGVLAFLSAGRRDNLIELLTRIALPQAGAQTSKKSSGGKKVKKKDKKKKDKKKKTDVP